MIENIVAGLVVLGVGQLVDRDAANGSLVQQAARSSPPPAWA